MTASSVAVRIGLPGRVADLGRGAGEALVLPLVVRHDPLEPVVGMEGPGAHQLGLVRLDAEAEVHDRVDLGVLGDERHHLGDRVAGLAAGEVDRVVPAPARRQLRVDRVAQVVGETASSRSGDAVIASAVTTPQPPAVVSTATWSLRQRLGREGRGRFERLLDGRGRA